MMCIARRVTTNVRWHARRMYFSDVGATRQPFNHGPARIYDIGATCSDRCVGTILTRPRRYTVTRSCVMEGYAHRFNQWLAACAARSGPLQQG